MSELTLTKDEAHALIIMLMGNMSPQEIKNGVGAAYNFPGEYGDHTRQLYKMLAEGMEADKVVFLLEGLGYTRNG